MSSPSPSADADPARPLVRSSSSVVESDLLSRVSSIRSRLMSKYGVDFSWSLDQASSDQAPTADSPTPSPASPADSALLSPSLLSSSSSSSSLLSSDPSSSSVSPLPSLSLSSLSSSCDTAALVSASSNSPSLSPEVSLPNASPSSSLPSVVSTTVATAEDGGATSPERHRRLSRSADSLPSLSEAAVPSDAAATPASDDHRVSFTGPTDVPKIDMNRLGLKMIEQPPPNSANVRLRERPQSKWSVSSSRAASTELSNKRHTFALQKKKGPSSSSSIAQHSSVDYRVLELPHMSSSSSFSSVGSSSESRQRWIAALGNKLSADAKRPVSSARASMDHFPSSHHQQQQQHDSDSDDSDDELMKPMEVRARRRHLAALSMTGLLKSCLLSAYLRKLGGRGLGQNWRKRWCVISAQSTLFYFRDINDPAPAGLIDLWRYTEAAAADDDGKGYVFSLRNPKYPDRRVYKFAADTAEQRNDWLRALDAVFSSQRGSSKALAAGVTIGRRDMTSAATTTHLHSTVRHHRTLYLRIAELRQQAAKLDSSASGELLDVYVQVSVENTTLRTRTVWKTREPFWGEDHTLVLDASPVFVPEDPWLHVCTGHDKVLGRARIDMAPLLASGDAHELWLPLHRPPKLLAFEQPHPSHATELLFQVYCKLPASPGFDTVVAVKLLSGRRLFRGDVPVHERNAQVSLAMGKQAPVKSKVQRQCRDPQWDQEFLWVVPTEDFGNVRLAGRLCHVRSRKSSETLLASFELPYWTYPAGQTTTVRIPLVYQHSSPTPPSTPTSSSTPTLPSPPSPPPSSSSATAAPPSSGDEAPSLFGDIRLKLQFQDQIVLPIHAYGELLTLLLDPEMALVAALEQFSKGAGKLEMIALTLAKIFQKKGMADHLISTVATREINATPTPEVLFRGNSLSSKLIDAYMKLVGLPYLKETLGPMIATVIHLRRQVEVDPAKLEKGADRLDKQIQFLFDLITQFISAIFGSIRRCPQIFRAIFSHLRKEVARRFQGHAQIDVIQFTTVSSMLFLRFFVPAILNPILFGLHDQFADETTARTLTLIAKSIQTLANLVEFGEKEPYMTPLNPFIMECTPLMIQFLNAVSTHDGTAVAQEITEEVWTEKELAVLAQTLRTILPDIQAQCPQPFADRVTTVLADLTSVEQSARTAGQT